MSKVLYWIPIAVAVILLSGMIYGTSQQILRTAANDPQIENAQYLAARFSQSDPNAPIDNLLMGTEVDIRSSLQPFVMVFDDNGKLLATNVNIEQVKKDTGAAITVPQGVFDFTKKNGEDRFTWQPLDSVRIAAVMAHFSGKSSGFVLTGRSLKEVEQREAHILQIVSIGLVVTLFASLFAVFIFVPAPRKSK